MPVITMFKETDGLPLCQEKKQQRKRRLKTGDEQALFMDLLHAREYLITLSAEYAMTDAAYRQPLVQILRTPIRTGRGGKRTSPPLSPKATVTQHAIAKALSREYATDGYQYILTENTREGIPQALQRATKALLRIRDKLVVNHLSLAAYYAHRLFRAWTATRYGSNAPLQVQDYVQYANEGLIRAVDCYNPKLSYKFSTYAIHWITHYIRRGVQDNARTVRLPVHVLDSYSKIAQAQRKLAAATGHKPTAAAIEGETGIPTARIRKVIESVRVGNIPYHLLQQEQAGQIMLESGALRTRFAMNNRMMQAQHAADPTCLEYQPLDDVLSERTIDRIRSLFFSLDDRAQYVLVRRLTHDDTLEDIGMALGVTGERVRQIQCEAIEYMRKRLTD